MYMDLAQDTVYEFDGRGNVRYDRGVPLMSHPRRTTRDPFGQSPLGATPM